MLASMCNICSMRRWSTVTLEFVVFYYPNCKETHVKLKVWKIKVSHAAEEARIFL